LGVLVNALFFGVLALLFLGMVAMQIAGHHYGLRRADGDSGGSSEGTAAVEATLFALLGLLVAFTFSGADTRLDARRKLIIQEANAIGTAYLRLDLLRAEDEPVLQDEMRRYVDSRLAYYDQLFDFRAAKAERARSEQLQQELWTHAVAASARAGDSRAALLVLQSLNALFDVATERYAALRTHVPVAIFVLLVVMTLACAFFAGIGMSKRLHPSYLHMVIFAGVMAVTAYVILNLEYPRVGFGRLHALDAFLREQRAAMR
jgi:hypothetical protein